VASPGGTFCFNLFRHNFHPVTDNPVQPQSYLFLLPGLKLFKTQKKKYNREKNQAEDGRKRHFKTSRQSLQYRWIECFKGYIYPARLQLIDELWPDACSNEPSLLSAFRIGTFLLIEINIL
jgi:hypothetical protein